MPVTTVTTRTNPTNPRSKQPKSRRRRAPRPTVVTKTKTRSARTRNRGRGNSPTVTAMQCYLRTLSDPWSYGPCRIGFGTMVPTSLATAYLRRVFAANSADGTFSVALTPSIVSMLYYNDSGLTSTSWGYANATNVGPLQQLASEYRVVSGGLRVIPQVPPLLHQV